MRINRKSRRPRRGLGTHVVIVVVRVVVIRAAMHRARQTVDVKSWGALKSHRLGSFDYDNDNDQCAALTIANRDWSV
jgi:hypothetical protein